MSVLFTKKTFNLDTTRLKLNHKKTCESVVEINFHFPQTAKNCQFRLTRIKKQIDLI